MSAPEQTTTLSAELNALPAFIAVTQPEEGWRDGRIQPSVHGCWRVRDVEEVAKAYDAVVAEGLLHRDIYRAALDDIAEETGTPYAQIAQAALDRCAAGGEA